MTRKPTKVTPQRVPEMRDVYVISAYITAFDAGTKTGEEAVASVLILQRD